MINYVLNPEKGTNGVPHIITHNLRSKEGDKHGYVKEFTACESTRKHVRNDNTRILHTIVSLSANEHPEAVTPEVMTAIAQKYISLRRDGVHLAAVHTDQAHTHLHVMSSGVKYATGMSARMSHRELLEIKLEMEHFIKENYPQLTESFCEHGKGKRYLSDRAWQKAHREERNKQKQELTQTVHALFEKATTQQHFLNILREVGLHHYERGNTIYGITTPTGEKFRFARLNIDLSQLPIQTQQQSFKPNTTMNREILEKAAQQNPSVLKALTELEELEKKFFEIDQDKSTVHLAGSLNPNGYTKEQQEELLRIGAEEIRLQGKYDDLVLSLETYEMQERLGIQLIEDKEIDPRDKLAEYKNRLEEAQYERLSLIGEWFDSPDIIPPEMEEQINQLRDEENRLSDSIVSIEATIETEKNSNEALEPEREEELEESEEEWKERNYREKLERLDGIYEVLEESLEQRDQDVESRDNGISEVNIFHVELDELESLREDDEPEQEHDEDEPER